MEEQKQENLTNSQDSFNVNISLEGSQTDSVLGSTPEHQSLKESHTSLYNKVYNNQTDLLKVNQPNQMLQSFGNLNDFNFDKKSPEQSFMAGNDSKSNIFSETFGILLYIF